MGRGLPYGAGVDKRPTIYDVAQEAGVAASTVSRAFSNPGRVNANTSRKVFEAAERIGYHSSALEGRVGARTRALALVVSDIANPFYDEIITGATDAAREAGYVLMILHTREDADYERTVIEGCIDLVEGIVFASTRLGEVALRKIAKRRPVVLLNRRMPEISCVVIDNARGIRRSAEHLGGLGHSSIAYLPGPSTSWADSARWRALREAAHELELVVRRSGTNCETPSVQAGFDAAEDVIATGATAVQTYNDALGVGLVRGLRARGVRVPVDISVVGFDNIQISQLVDPMLTTVASPLRSQGHTGVTNVLALVRGRAKHSGTLELPVKLVVRQTTARPGRIIHRD
nr:LacI family DNA-binding transcriptional regulator [Flexivirga oryzae]